MNGTPLRALALSAALGFALPAVPANALELPSRTRPMTRPGVPARVPVPVLLNRNGTAIHQFFGTITRLESTTTFLAQLRNGRSVTVDASPAIKTGSYSAPLFVGKGVLVEGNWSGSTFFAARVTRMTRIDSTLGPDR